MSIPPSLDRLVTLTVPRDVLVVCGPEAAMYLHGQISADVTSMEIGDSSLSFLLEPRGRIEAFFVISRTGPDTYVADTEAGFGEAMAASLERFKLRTRADFSLGQWQAHAVRGPQAAGEPAVRATSTGPAGAPQHVVRPAHWPLATGHDLLAGPGSVTTQFGDGGETISTDGFEALRMAYGLPAFGTEIQPGDIPNETGLVERAASFTKGCYRGQELVERIDSRTGGRRTVCRLRSSVPLAAGDELRDGSGAAVATVLSAATLNVSTVGFARSRNDAGEVVYTASGDQVQLAGVF